MRKFRHQTLKSSLWHLLLGRLPSQASQTMLLRTLLTQRPTNEWIWQSLEILMMPFVASRFRLPFHSYLCQIFLMLCATLLQALIAPWQHSHQLRTGVLNLTLYVPCNTICWKDGLQNFIYKNFKKYYKDRIELLRTASWPISFKNTMRSSLVLIFSGTSTLGS